MTDAPIAGWYPDPRNTTARWRWWNGRGWTDDTAPRTDVRRAADWSDVAASPYRSTLSTQAVSANNPWVWLLAFGWYVSGAIGAVPEVALFLIFPPALTNPDPASIIIPQAVGLAVGAASFLVFAELDRRALLRAGLPQVSPLWMLIIPPLVYFVVRHRRLAAVGASSRGPELALRIIVWLQVGSIVLSIALVMITLLWLGGVGVFVPQFLSGF